MGTHSAQVAGQREPHHARRRLVRRTVPCTFHGPVPVLRPARRRRRRPGPRGRRPGDRVAAQGGRAGRRRAALAVPHRRLHARQPPPQGASDPGGRRARDDGRRRSRVLVDGRRGGPGGARGPVSPRPPGAPAARLGRSGRRPAGRGPRHRARWCRRRPVPRSRAPAPGLGRPGRRSAALVLRPGANDCKPPGFGDTFPVRARALRRITMDDRTPQDVAAEDAAVARLRAADPGAGVVPDTVALRSAVDERRAAPDVRADVPDELAARRARRWTGWPAKIAGVAAAALVVGGGGGYAIGAAGDGIEPAAAAITLQAPGEGIAPTAAQDGAAPESLMAAGDASRSYWPG